VTAATESEPASGCLFCKIVAGEVPSDEVTSDRLTYAFRDINPGAPSHVLVVPRDHLTDAAELRAHHGELLGAMFETAQQVAELEGLSNGYRLVFNVGEDSGNTVPHLHLHVLGGRSMSWPPG
jgi:histidine triad (HIT) family protein